MDCGGVREAGFGDYHSHRDGTRRRWDGVIGGCFGGQNQHTTVGNGCKAYHRAENACGRLERGAGCFRCRRIGDDVWGRVEFPYKFDVAVGSHLKVALNDG